jgi:hypothetical protein
MIVVTKLDRLARSVAHLVEITAELKRKGVDMLPTSCAGHLKLHSNFHHLDGHDLSNGYRQRISRSLGWAAEDR